MNTDILFQCISCCSGNFCDNGTVFAQQHIHQRRFPCIWFSKDNCLDTFLDNSAIVRRIKHFLKFIHIPTDLNRQFIAKTFCLNMLGIIQRRLNKSNIAYDSFTQLLDFLLNASS